jgi:hypothetical protein
MSLTWLDICVAKETHAYHEVPRNAWPAFEPVDVSMRRVKPRAPVSPGAGQPAPMCPFVHTFAPVTHLWAT